MDDDFLVNSSLRKVWAVSLCYAAALLMTLEALRPGACAAFHMSDQQCFAISAAIASLSIFLGTFILMEVLVQRGPPK